MTVARAWIWIGAIAAAVVLVVALTGVGSKEPDSPLTPRASSAGADPASAEDAPGLRAPVDPRRSDADGGAARDAIAEPVPSPSESPAADVPAQPPSHVGLAGRSDPILGGASAIESFHAASTFEMRRDRIEALRAVFAAYVDGDPRDPIEFDQYQALKDELAWLTAHPAP